MIAGSPTGAIVVKTLIIREPIQAAFCAFPGRPETQPAGVAMKRREFCASACSVRLPPQCPFRWRAPAAMFPRLALPASRWC